MTAAPEPVPEEALEDLRRRLRATRLVPVPGTGWSRGADPDHLTGLLDVRDRVDEPSGGHFAAWERPEACAAGVHRAVALPRLPRGPLSPGGRCGSPSRRA